MLRRGGRDRSCSGERQERLAGDFTRPIAYRPCSKVVIRFLTVMMKHGYIGEFEVVDDHRAGKIVVNLTGRLNKCGVISPRFVTSPAVLKFPN